MGNCLSHDPWKKLKKNQLDRILRSRVKTPGAKSLFAKKTFVIGEAIKQCSKNNRVAFEISNEENVPVKSDSRCKPVNNNAVDLPATGAAGSGAVSSNYQRAAEAPKDVEELQLLSSFKDVNIFTYKELTIATDYFRPDLILGEGGFGLVYKGVIDENVRAGFKSTKVAVKELNPEGYQGDREWLAEVNYLGQFSNPNLVKLIGYCCEDKHRLLVYEYMACGSLETHLFRRHNSLTWPIRMNIALDAAKGLAFLHGAERPIIYRDFKTSNILLDSEFNAKISDFGLAKEGPMGDQTHVSTRVMGTYGYAAPEYIMTGHLTARSDVYGFGVVLLEILVGKRALDKRRPNQEHNLVEWARPLLIRGTKLLWILDPKMQGQYSTETAYKIGSLAYRCLSENPKSRPTMSEVVKSLESYIEEERLYQVRKASEKDSCEAIVDSSPKGQARSNPCANNGENSSATEDRWRTKPGGGRSRSDPPPKDFDHRHSPSQEPAAT